MKKTFNKTIALTAAALVFGTGAELTMAGGGFGGCDGDRKGGKHYRGMQEQGMAGDRYGMMGERMLRKLDWELELTDQQRDQIRDLMKERQQKMTDRKGQKQNMYQQMRELDPAAADYQQQVAELATQQAETVRQRLVDRAEGMAELYAVLTPEQQQKFKELQDQWGEKRGRKGSRWH